MMKYSFSYVSQHIVMQIDGHLLVLDTGSPLSFGRESTIDFCGRHVSLQNSFMGFGPDQLSENIGEKVDGLLGGDVLNIFDSIWDYENQKITFSETELPANGVDIELEFVMGVPTVSLLVDGEEQKWFVDTGAVTSFVSNKPDGAAEPIGTHQDFYPGFGSFETDVYEVEIQLYEEPQKISVGVLPDLLGMSLMVSGCSGILGLNAFGNGNIGYFPRRNVLVLIG